MMPTAIPPEKSLGPSAPARTLRNGWLGAAADYWQLTKPEVNFLVLVSTLAGFDLARRGPLGFTLLLNTLLGTLLVAGGTGTLNQYMERQTDASMRRTARRPLPAGRLPAVGALAFGLAISAAGGALLWFAVNPLSSILALFTLVIYLVIYTPLKRKTPLCTLVGAFPGAMPPLIGWAAARGQLNLEAWVLYGILFLWQFPHFLAIAWMYREDYSRAGLRMLPQGDDQGRFTSREIMAFLFALVPVSLVPAFLGDAGTAYLVGALALGIYFVFEGFRLARARTGVMARQVVLASVIYLPLVFALMVLDRAPF